jgi:penicillin-binding protein 2
MAVDWHQIHVERREVPEVVDPRRRLALFLAGFMALCAVVVARVGQLYFVEGAAFRAEAAKPSQRRAPLPGVRGRILACDGTVLACDKKVLALAVHYRYLEDPPDARWLNWAARLRLPGALRKDRLRVADEASRLCAERKALARRLARLCGLSDDEWDRRARQVQGQVERTAASIRRREAQASPRASDPPATPWGKWKSKVLQVLRASAGTDLPRPVTIAEQLDYHVMVEDLPLPVVAEIEAHPHEYPAVHVVPRQRRLYPCDGLACHVLGYLGRRQAQERPADQPGPQSGRSADVDGALSAPEYPTDDRVGRMGLEQRYERLLRGRPGVAVDSTDHSGRVLSSRQACVPGVGRDLVIRLHPQLQKTAEALLRSALERRAIRRPQDCAAGGAIVVIDARHGGILAAASAPGFDPNRFRDGDPSLEAVLHDPAHPLFDRALRMAIAPGSVFKVVSALAMLAEGIDPCRSFTCRGYLDDPERFRCAVYRRRGVGHGAMTLPDALAESCNVYFFHYAERIGPGPLVDWAARLGFGRPTGVDLPEESGGLLPAPSKVEAPRPPATDLRLLAIGQGALEVTPLQVVRMMAAVANGGYLVTPHLASGLGPPEIPDASSTEDLGPADDEIRVPAPQPIPGLKPAMLDPIRQGLRRVVCDPRGTAHATAWLGQVDISGKTGTAETGVEAGEHAWFAGYAPSEAPRVAFVVVLEHGGNADEAAGPVARRLVARMHELGMTGAR